MTTQNTIRLNKFISNSGFCNRRQADDYISQGRVSVNDKIIVRLGSKVSLKDSVKLDGRKVFPVKMQYIILNKPKRVLLYFHKKKFQNCFFSFVFY